MTDYFDKPAKKASPAKVVSVSLAGVLAAGMVPAMAFAQAPGTVDEVAPVSNDEIMPITVSPENAFENAALYHFVWSDKATTLQTASANTPNTKTNAALIPTEIKLVGGTTLTVAKNNNGYTVTSAYTLTQYKVAANGSTIPGTSDVGQKVTTVSGPGTYYAVLTAKTGTYANYSAVFKYTVGTPKVLSVEGDYVTLVNTDELAAAASTYSSTAATTAFAFNGGTPAIGVGYEGTSGTYTLLEEGVDYSISYAKAGGGSVGGVFDVGGYVATITGMGEWSGQAQIQFAVTALNIANGTASSGAPKVSVSLSPSIGTGLPNPNNLEFTLSYVTSKKTVTADLGQYVTTTPNANPGGNGVYTYNVKSNGSTNITGVATTASYTRVQNLSTFTYNSEPLQDGQVFTIDVTETNGLFDLSKIGVKNGTSAVGTYNSEKTAGAYTIYVDGTAVSNGNSFSAANATLKSVTTPSSTPGVHTVKVVMTPNTTYSYGGEVTFTVKATKGEIDGDSNVVVTYGDQVIGPDGITLPYNGTTGYSIGTDFSATITSENGGAIGDADTTITFTDSEGTKVTGTALIKPGTYTGTVTAAGYTFTGDSNVFTVTIAPISASDLFISNGGTDASDIIPNGIYTTASGTEINLTPNVLFKSTDGTYNSVKTAIAGADVTWADATTGSSVTKITKAGTYTATVTFANDAQEPITLKLIVLPVGDEPYADVPGTAWYAGAVYNASAQGYMTGYGDSVLFGPDDLLNRAQAATILARMAGVDPKTWAPAGSVSGTEYPTPFADVAANAWYAQAVLWADQTKVMKGYGPSYTEFGPMDNITREQFAIVLYNYATALGKDVSVDMAAAQAKPDWSSVSSWAQTAVAWAVENGIIGVGSPINPQGTVTRAEAAAMTTRYQPTKLK